MQYIFSIFILGFTLFCVVRFIVKSVIRKKKASKFFIKHFNEDRLYTLSEVASSFNIEDEHFHKLLSILQNYKYFHFFNKRGVDMIKDYYSGYELKFLIKILLKKNKLK